VYLAGMTISKNNQGENDKSKKTVCICFGKWETRVLYTGVTSDLIICVWQHKNGFVNGYTKRYSIHVLVYYEIHVTMKMAILREKQIKRWKRNWRIRLIEKTNPSWNDLYYEIM
jgi:putative endonuclease